MSNGHHEHEAPPEGRRLCVGPAGAPSTHRLPPAIDQRACLLCGACRSACPAGAIEIRGGAVVIREALCDGCRACVDACTPAALR